MKINSIGPSFGIRRKENIVRVNNNEVRTIEGEINNNKITIYNYFENDKLKAKLYYLQDKLGNCIKSKLKKGIR